MIEIRQLSKTFAGLPALQDVSFSVSPGERVALIGCNGAGKTTLLRILATFLPATSGFASIFGHDLFSESEAVRAITGYLPENAPLYLDMRVEEYLKFRGKLRRMGIMHLHRRLHEVVAFCDLLPYRNATINSLSCGLRRRVGIADAILNEPKVLLLDDPLASCDPYQADKITDLLSSRDICADRTLIFTTHSRETVQAIASRILFLDRGRVCADTRDMACLKDNTLQAMFGKWQSPQESETEDTVK